MKVSEFKRKYPNSPVIGFLEKQPIATILFVILVVSFIAKIF
jgi:hypothetical protein